MTHFPDQQLDDSVTKDLTKKPLLNRMDFWLTLIVVTAAYIATFLLFRRIAPLYEFCDEGDKLTTAYALRHGYRLYDTIFTHHGPLAGALLHIWSVLFKPVEISSMRYLVYALYAAASLCIGLSPVYRGRRKLGWFSAIVFLSLVSTSSVAWWGHMVLYQNIAAAFFIAALFIGVVPAWTGHLKTERINTHVFLTALLLASIPFIGISYCVAVLLAAVLFCGGLLLSGHTIRSWIVPFCLGSAAAVIMNVLYLMMFGSLKGFVEEYIYFNFGIYAGFAETSAFAPFIALFTEHIEGLHLFFVLWCIPTALAISIVRTKRSTRFVTRVVCFAGFILFFLYLNPRGLSAGAPWHSSTFFTAGCSFLPLLFIALPKRKFSIPLLAGLCLVFLLPFGWMMKSNTLYADKDEHGFLKIHYYAPARTILDVTTEPHDPVAALFLHPGFYFYVDRLPATDCFYYLPWQAEWERNTYFDGRKTVLDQLIENPPPVIFLYHWIIGDLYDSNEYGAELVAFAKSNYIEITEAPYIGAYIRPDVLADHRAELERIRAISSPAK